MEKIVKQLAKEINTKAFYKTHVTVDVTVRKVRHDGTVPVVLKLRKYGQVAYDQTCNGFAEAIQILNTLKFQLAYTILAA